MCFDDVRSLVPYLTSLGISHLYLSPSLQARSGSTHGYDVIDPTRVSEALGGEEGLRALAAAGLGIILDIVPNHMGTGDENRWWADETERVRVFDVDPETGNYRRFFDIDDLAGVRVEDPTSSSSRTARSCRCWRTASSRGCASTIPTGSPIRLATCSGSRTPVRAMSGSRRSCTPASPCASGPSRAPSATSSSTTCRGCSSIRRVRCR